MAEENVGHTHGPTSGRKMWMSLLVTLAFVAGEAFAGWRAHSLALLSDAGHNLTDALALGLAAFAVWVARRPATAKRTFGYHRAAILTAQFNAITLVGLAVWIGIEAYHHFLHPEPVSGSLMIWVALVAVLMNTVIAATLHGEAKHSINSRAAFVHMAGDALSSLAVVAAGIIIHFTHWVYADPLVSALIALFIGYSAWGIVREATDILMESTPKGLDTAAVVSGIKRIAPVREVHDLHVWTVGDGLIFLSCHVALPESTTLRQCADIVRAINKKLHDDFAIGHATIQTEVDGLCDWEAEEGIYCKMESHQHESGHAHHH